MVKRRKIEVSALHELWEEQCQRRLEWPHSWLFSSMSLKRAANVLWCQVQKDYEAVLNSDHDKLSQSISSTLLLVLGYCIENLIKGLCIQKEGAFNAKGEFRFKNHKLLDLLEKVDIHLSDKEIELTERLEQFIIWAGKYPGPLDYTDLMPRILPNGGFAPLDMACIPTDYEIAINLVDKLETKLKDSKKNKI